MTVPAKPFWLSSAKAEYSSNGWTSDTLSKSGIPAPRNAGDLAGRSASTSTTLTTMKWASGIPAGNMIVGYDSTTGKGSLANTTPAQVGVAITYIAVQSAYPTHISVSTGSNYSPAFRLEIAGLGVLSIAAGSGNRFFNTGLSTYSWFDARVGAAMPITFYPP